MLVVIIVLVVTKNKEELVSKAVSAVEASEPNIYSISKLFLKDWPDMQIFIRILKLKIWLTVKLSRQLLARGKNTIANSNGKTLLD